MPPIHHRRHVAKKKKILEVCCGDIQSVIAAYNGGANRVELCSALDEGGLTPSWGMIKEALRISHDAELQGRSFRIHVLIRPRPGDFCYSPTETALMAEDIREAVRLGTHGIVIGALTPEGKVDKATMKYLIKAAKGASVTFHRAIDMCDNPLKALDDIMELGCKRVLTSGWSSSAIEGLSIIDLFRTKIEGTGIEIIAAAGVNAENARKIIDGAEINEIHASARKSVESQMRYRHNNVNMGKEDADEYTYLSTSEDEVRAIVESINS